MGKVGAPRGNKNAAGPRKKKISAIRTKARKSANIKTEGNFRNLKNDRLLKQMAARADKADQEKRRDPLKVKVGAKPPALSRDIDREARKEINRRNKEKRRTRIKKQG